MTQSPSYVASEDIATSVFVSLVNSSDPADFHKIKTADSGELAVGVSHEGPMDPVLPGGSVGPAILAGRSGRIYGINENAFLKSSTTINAGAYLKPAGDNSGRAVTAASGDKFSAYTRTGAAEANVLMQVTLEQGTVP